MTNKLTNTISDAYKGTGPISATVLTLFLIPYTIIIVVSTITTVVLNLTGALMSISIVALVYIALLPYNAAKRLLGGLNE